jgi:hypothetical protein
MESIYFDHLLNADEVEKIEGYLAAKWGVDLAQPPSPLRGVFIGQRKNLRTWSDFKIKEKYGTTVCIPPGTKITLSDDDRSED